MRYLISALLAFAFITTHAEAKTVQLVGTHGFVTLPDSFSLSLQPKAYISPDKKLVVLGFRFPMPLKAIESSSDFPKEFIVLPKSKRHAYLLSKELNGKTFYAYETVLGNDDESVGIGVGSLDSSQLDKNKELIINIMDSATYESGSDLGFESLYFFNIKNLFGLKPVLATPVFLFQPDGYPGPHSPLTLAIGRYPRVMDFKGREKELADYCLNPNKENIKVIDKKYKNIFVDGHDAIMLDATYIKKDAQEHEKLAVIFEQKNLTIISENSTERSFDANLDNFEKILDGFTFRN